MTAQIDLAQLFNAIVAHYDQNVGPRLVGTAFDNQGDPELALLRARLPEHERVPLGSPTDDILAQLDAGTVSYIEMHCLRAACCDVRNFAAMTPDFTAAQLADRMRKYTERVDHKGDHQPLTPHLVLGGLRELARQRGINDVPWPDMTRLEQKIGMAPL